MPKQKLLVATVPFPDMIPAIIRKGFILIQAEHEQV